LTCDERSILKHDDVNEKVKTPQFVTRIIITALKMPLYYQNYEGL
jgi:hypothetical protein